MCPRYLATYMQSADVHQANPHQPEDVRHADPLMAEGDVHHGYFGQPDWAKQEAQEKLCSCLSPVIISTMLA